VGMGKLCRGGGGPVPWVEGLSWRGGVSALVLWRSRETLNASKRRRGPEASREEANLTIAGVEWKFQHFMQAERTFCQIRNRSIPTQLEKGMSLELLR